MSFRGSEGFCLEFSILDLQFSILAGKHLGVVSRGRILAGRLFQI
jgi:hypothetical protein